MSDIISRAARFAKAAHESIDQRRKYSGEPYIVHPKAVAAIVATVTRDEHMISAAWLHDVVEDTLEELLPEAFAVVKSACERMRGESWEAGGAKITWDMVQYDVQLLGGVVLHEGQVAEMKTGEGKTLVALAPVYLNALPGRGVHVVTVNPYLAQRDAEWIGPLYEYLGLTVDVIDKYEAHSEARRAAPCPR